MSVSTNTAVNLPSSDRIRGQSRWLNWLGLVFIRWYQRYLSPHKGYVCAHRMRHVGLSCSQFGQLLLQRRSVWEFYPLLKRRFRRCSLAAIALRSQSFVDEKDPPSPSRPDESNEKTLKWDGAARDGKRCMIEGCAEGCGQSCTWLGN